MSRLTQISRNSYIRLEGLLYQLFGFFRKLLEKLFKLFNSIARLVGFTDSQYFLEASAPDREQTKAAPDTQASAQYSPPTANNARLRSDKNMEYFLKMVQQEKKAKS